MPTYFDLLPLELNLMIWKKVHEFHMEDIKIELEARYIWFDTFGVDTLGDDGCKRCRHTGARCSDCSIWNWIPQDITYKKFINNYPEIYRQAEEDRSFDEQARRLI